MKLSQKSLDYKVLQNILHNKFIAPGDEIVVACSGGGDSVCLLQVLIDLQEKLDCKISACHFNHKMRGEESEADEKFVKKFCRERGVDCRIGRARKIISSEESARKARYAFFEEILHSRRGAKVALAHHANDVAETVLFNLIRGTGLEGLCGIPASRGKFFRPLLPFSREEVVSYLEEKGLPYCTDKSNADLSQSRNLIRHKIIPLLKKINPMMEKTVYGDTIGLGEDLDHLEAAAAKEFQKVALSLDENQIVISREKWLDLSSSMKSRTLRHTIDLLVGLSDVTRLHLQEVKLMIEKGQGKKHTLLPRSLRIELESGKIIVSKIL